MEKTRLSVWILFFIWIIFFRYQFRRPLAANQLMQKKMADMMTEVNMKTRIFWKSFFTLPFPLCASWNIFCDLTLFQYNSHYLLPYNLFDSIFQQLWIRCWKIIFIWFVEKLLFPSKRSQLLQWKCRHLFWASYSGFFFWLLIPLRLFN